MKTLTLPVNKAAFDMLADPNPETRKNQEYRLPKHYYTKRFLSFPEMTIYEWNDFHLELWSGRHNLHDLCKGFDVEINVFDIVKFTNGYGNKVPFVMREWEGLDIGLPNPLWVPKGFLDLDREYFRIKLGDIKK